VIHGGGGRHDQLFGEEGDDTLAGGPWSDRFSGGPGHDVAVAVNLANDMVDLDGIPEVSIGAGACTWQRPLNIQPDGSAEQGRMSCTLPWPRRLSGLDPVLSVSGSIDPEGDVSVSGSLFRGMGSVAVADWRRIARGQNATAKLLHGSSSAGGRRRRRDGSRGRPSPGRPRRGPREKM
jgi:hypothetical protein